MLNHSSLHAFYRARLTRSFLGAANPARFAQRGDDSELAMLDPVRARGAAMRFVEADARDDIGLADYAPHRHGGPVHLINVCVNETQNLRGGLVERRPPRPADDAGAAGFGAHGPVGLAAAARVGQDHTLGTWMAVSGAALAPGLGNLTQPGIAALLTMMGARLGPVVDGRGALVAGRARQPSAQPAASCSGRELLGRFDCRQPAWFLSDGGHYENTGAYALLAQETALAVVADCGADPLYQFGDLENLVRLARIDLQAEVQFLKPRPGTQPPRHLGSLDDLASHDSEACIAVGLVHYLRSGREGLLVVVKPNLFQGLPIDLVNFRRKHEGFPQQATTDQFFSEAQWESYHKLGEVLGQMLVETGLLDPARPWAPLMVADDGRPVHGGVEDPAELGGPRPAGRLGPALDQTGGGRQRRRRRACSPPVCRCGACSNGCSRRRQPKSRRRCSTRWHRPMAGWAVAANAASSAPANWPRRCCCRPICIAAPSPTRRRCSSGARCSANACCATPWPAAAWSRPRCRSAGRCCASVPAWTPASASRASRRASRCGAMRPGFTSRCAAATP